MATVTPAITTAEQLWAMPDNGQRHELVRGELRTMAPPGYEHGKVIIRLGRLLEAYVTKARLGEVTGADAGFLLKRDPDTVRGPDVAFVAASRVANTAAFYRGCPDLAVEVVSPGDTFAEVEEKVDQYLDAGTKAVWVVNPRRRTVNVYRPGQDTITLRESDTLDGGDIIPGFACKVADVFPD